MRARGGRHRAEGPGPTPDRGRRSRRRSGRLCEGAGLSLSFGQTPGLACTLSGDAPI